jgi:hypothetical protein
MTVFTENVALVGVMRSALRTYSENFKIRENLRILGES